MTARRSEISAKDNRGRRSRGEMRMSSSTLSISLIFLSASSMDDVDAITCCFICGLAYFPCMMRVEFCLFDRGWQWTKNYRSLGWLRTHQDDVKPNTLLVRQAQDAEKRTTSSRWKERGERVPNNITPILFYKMF